jgi:hypothetical protein
MREAVEIILFAASRNICATLTFASGLVEKMALAYSSRVTCALAGRSNF